MSHPLSPEVQARNRRMINRARARWNQREERAPTVGMLDYFNEVTKPSLTPELNPPTVPPAQAAPAAALVDSRVAEAPVGLKAQLETGAKKRLMY